VTKPNPGCARSARSGPRWQKKQCPQLTVNGGDDPVAGPQGLNLGAHLLDDAHEFVPHDGARPATAIAPRDDVEVGAAQARAGDADEGVVGVLQARGLAVLDADRAHLVHDHGFHGAQFASSEPIFVLVLVLVLGLGPPDRDPSWTPEYEHEYEHEHEIGRSWRGDLPRPQSLRPSVTKPLGNATIIKRLLALGWAYRRHCLQVLGYQVALLALGLMGLGLAGWPST
jgi:hypothetical protein